MLGRRSVEKEIMDVEAARYEETKAAYQFMEKVNRFLGGRRVVLHHLSQFLKLHPGEKGLSLLDLGTGGGDIPRNIFSWAKRKELPLKIVGFDFEAQALRYSKEDGLPSGVYWVQGDLTRPLPFKDQSFDFCLASMVFHHLSEEEAVRALKEMDRVSRRGIIVNDLLRRVRAYLWIYFLSRLSGSRLVKNDAPLSVLRGFKKREVERIKGEASLDYLQFHYHFGHRFSLAGVKNGF